jgi:hypothetical protein
MNRIHPRLETAAMAVLGLLALGACGKDAGDSDARVETRALTSAQADAFRYGMENIDPATYWASISNLANPIMFSGLGEEIEISMTQRDDWLRRAGFTKRPSMEGLAVVGPVYAAGSPEFVERPDYGDPATLRWDPASFDSTLDPGAQAWALLKITSPEFHLQYHDLPANKLAALMMIPQATAQAKLLEEKLLTPPGVFAPRMPSGRFGAATPRDQVAVLWAVSSLISAATSDADDYWHEAYRDLVDAEEYRPLAETAFAAVRALPPQDPATYAIGIEALGRYALVAPADERSQALEIARAWAQSLMTPNARGDLEDIALSIYGLAEASRLLDDTTFLVGAAQLFRQRLLPLWNDRVEVFRNQPDQERIVYTPFTVGAVIAALDALRWYGPRELRSEAAHLYPTFFENAIVRSGLLRSSPLPLVQPEYLKEEPAASFAHPTLTLPEESGVAPVFAGEVVYENGNWMVTDSLFLSEPSLFLCNMLAVRSGDRVDTFLPAADLAAIKGR